MITYVDTSAFYAAVNESQVESARMQEALTSSGQLITSDHVLVETWRLLRDWLSLTAAETFWAELRAGAAQVECVKAADLDAAWLIGQQFADQDFSLVDRTSFAIMGRLRITRVATLDADFAIFRYGPRRDRAFEILR